MKILADENIDAPLVSWLRQQGHDVVWVAESAPGIPDQQVLRRAHRARRILLTNDLDFGELVFKGGHAAAGVVLLRIRARRVNTLLARFVAAWPEIQLHAPRNYLVVSNDRIRSRAMPRRS